MQDHGAKIDWRDGCVPVSRRFGDPYFSIDDGPQETRHVFLAGNGLPQRFGGSFRIAETGFGTGLNLLVTWAAWEAAGASGTLSFTSFEAFPMSPDDRATALAAFPALEPYTARLQAALAAGTEALAPGLSLRVVPGDVRETLPLWEGQVDAWFLDGFAPARNPEMWGPDLMAEVARHTAPGGTFATYTAAGHVRAALAAAGFDVRRAPGFGRKRHMSTGRLT